MAKSKVTISLDKEKAAKAAAFLGGRNLSQVVDVALERLIQTEQLRHDLAAYAGRPLSDDEMALTGLPVEFDLDDDDVDYEALYGRDL
jgi:hypothetical protein